MMRILLVSILVLPSLLHPQVISPSEITILQPYTSTWDVRYRCERVGEVKQKEDGTRFTLFLQAPVTLDEDCFKPTFSLTDNVLQIQTSIQCPDSGQGIIPIICIWDDSIQFEKVRLNGKEIPVTEDPYHITQPNATFSLFEGDTINLTDIHGIRRGPWLTFDADSNVIWEVVYQQNTIPSGFYRTYDDSGYLANRSFYVLGHVLYARKLKDELPVSEEFWNIGTQLPGFEKAECQFTPNGLLRRVRLYFYGGEIRVLN